ncbi:MAG: YjbQ family protein [Bacteroidales bacterium]|nr:YjbQ family protein [Bacteroidales bacterium]
MIKQFELVLRNYPRGYHLITSQILSEIGELPQTGLLNVFIKHTSAGLTLNENADSSVRDDFESVLNKIIPEGLPQYTHVFEGSDDMPAHLKSSLVGVSLIIPISNGRLNLGTWQGIYLCEFRNHGGRRNLVLTIYS